MTNPFDGEGGEFLVLINDERQYSLWPAHLDIPAGWRETGPRGAREVCTAWVDEHWTDMRPRGLADRMDEDSTVRKAKP